MRTEKEEAEEEGKAFFKKASTKVSPQWVHGPLIVFLLNMTACSDEFSPVSVHRGLVRSRVSVRSLSSSSLFRALASQTSLMSGNLKRKESRRKLMNSNTSLNKRPVNLRQVSDHILSPEQRPNFQLLSSE